MLELIARLPAGARVLDLGAAAGSFSTARRDILVVRLDLEPPAGVPSGVPSCPARALTWRAMPPACPSPPDRFDLIIANHSLEHFALLEETVREMGRVLRQEGHVFISVPDASTLTDRIYRWLARGGGHVNPFRRPEEVTGMVERLAGVKHRGHQSVVQFAFLPELP